MAVARLSDRRFLSDLDTDPADAVRAVLVACSSYSHRMAKRAVSMTLDTDNLLWLSAQAGPGGSVSRIVDDLVGEARASGRRLGTAARSVAGTVDLRNFDPATADRELRALFDAALGGNAAVREQRARYGTGRTPTRSTL